MSDPLVVACPGCGQKLRVPADRRTDPGRCPKCRSGFHVAADGTATAVSRRPSRRTLLAVGAGGLAAAAGGWWWFAPADEFALPDERPPVADGPPPDAEPPPLPKDLPVRVACVGDSISAGNLLSAPAVQNVPARLAEALGPLYKVKNFAVGGRAVLSTANHPYTATPEYRQALEFRPHRVVVQLGTNDAWPHNSPHWGRLAADYRELVQSFRRLPSRPRVYACLPPPVFPGNPGLDAAAVRGTVTDAIREVADQLRLPVVDLHAPLADSGELFPDGLHPNAEGAKRIAQAIAVAVRADERTDDR